MLGPQKIVIDYYLRLDTALMPGAETGSLIKIKFSKVNT